MALVVAALTFWEETSSALATIDEIDELGFSRDEESSPVYELLRLMDGAEDLRGLTLLATTNRPQVLDEALLRPGRFGPGIEVEAPSPEPSPPSTATHTNRWAHAYAARANSSPEAPR